MARRPLDWRPDYKPKIASWLFKNRTEVAGEVLYVLFAPISHNNCCADYVDPIKRSLHPLLLFTQSDPPIYQNLLETPFHSSSIEFLNVRRPHNDIDLAQLACQPSSDFSSPAFMVYRRLGPETTLQLCTGIQMFVNFRLFHNGFSIRVGIGDTIAEDYVLHYPNHFGEKAESCEGH